MGHSAHFCQIAIVLKKIGNPGRSVICATATNSTLGVRTVRGHCPWLLSAVILPLIPGVKIG